MSARPIIAALGDSLTVGEHADGAPLHNHPWPALLDALLFPLAGVGQFGLGGDTIVASGPNPGMTARWRQYIQGNGFALRILWGGVNDIIGDVPGLTVAANAQALLLEMLAEGPTLFVFTPGFGSYSGWTSGRQVELVAYRAAMAAFAAAQPSLLTLDLYPPAPVGIGDPSNPTEMLPADAYSDGLHINPDPGATRVASLVYAKVAPLFAVEPSSTPVAGQPKELLLKLGDELPPLAFQLLDRLGAAVPIGGGSVVFSLGPASGGTPTVLPCSVIDASSGQVALEWPHPLGLVAGDYLGSFVLTAEAPSSRPATFPYGRAIVVRIY